MEKYLQDLLDIAVFDKNQLFLLIERQKGKLGNSTLEKYLQLMLEKGIIARVGRNGYCVKGNLQTYEYKYSELALYISEILQTDYNGLDFRIMELYQLNRFLNHQIAHNVIFVYVEKDMCVSVFERLKREYEGKVLINPKDNDFYHYRTEDTIIVKNLLTEAPKSKKCYWHTVLEKLLVDVFSDSLLKTMFSESEYPQIYETTFNTYVIDESQMFRYAKRRKSAERIQKFIREETSIKLRTIK